MQTPSRVTSVSLALALGAATTLGVLWYSQTDSAGMLKAQLAPSSCPLPAEAAALDGWLSGNGHTRADISAACDGSDHLTGLSAPDGVQLGTIPPLMSFPQLAHVNLQNNGMAGSLPTGLAQLPLDRFWITGSTLAGTIPALPSTLTSLHLGNNQLTGSIPTLPPSIEEFHLFHNSLSGPIPPLAGLTSLWRFNLEGNELTGPIPALPTSGTLVHIQVGFNKLTGDVPLLPSGLTDFIAQENQLDGTIVAPLPSSLRFFWAPLNTLAGPIPAISGTQLTTFHVGNNLLTGSFPTLPQSMEKFYIFHNQIVGPVPSLASFTSLVEVNIAFNAFTGTLPVLPASVHQFVATNNRFVGPIPQPFPAALSTTINNVVGVYSVYNNLICPPYPYPTDGRTGTFALEPQDTSACFACTGPVPANATLCTGDDSGLTADVARTTVASCGTPKCEYTCSAGFILQGGVCVAEQFSCTGPVPANATLCTGDASDLTADVARTTVTSCGTPKCEYTCVSPATLQDGLCVTVAGGLTLNLTVPLEGRLTAAGGIHGTHATSTLDVTIKKEGSANPPATASSVATNDVGNASVPFATVTAASGDVFTVSLKDAQHLRRTVRVTAGASGTIALDLGDPSTYADVVSTTLRGVHFLPAGDIEGSASDHDNIVDTFDVGVWITDFRADGTTSMLADLDANGAVGSEDLSLIIRNYNTQGDASA